MSVRGVPVEARFWAKVAKSPNGCWEWQAFIMASGYGGFVHGREQRAHRVSWVLAHGPIPEGLCVLHRCDNRRCVRPDHLFLGTRADNTADMMQKGRDRHPTGASHGFRKHPEAAPRGDRNGSRLHPETRPKGEGHANAKLDDVRVRAMRAAHDEGASVHALSREFGVSRPTVKGILTRKAWRHVE